MKPRITFTFTLLGVLLVGLSLHSLTTAPARVSEVKQAQTAPTEPIYATLRFTGQPLSLVLRHGGKEWQVDTALQPAEIELEDGTHKQVKFLSLTPAGMSFDPDATEEAAE